MKHKLKIPYYAILIGFLGLFTLQGCHPKKTEVTTPATTVVSVLSSNPDYSLFVSAIKRANLESALTSYVPFTVFAPNNAAFQAAGFDQAKISSTDTATLAKLVEYHILSGRQHDQTTFSSKIDSSSLYTTTSGIDFYVSGNGGVLFNGPNVKISGATSASTNGLIIPINALLIPPTQSISDKIYNDPNYSLLKAALVREGSALATKVTLMDSLSGYVSANVGDTVKISNAETVVELLKGTRYTLLAPNDAAFASSGIDLNAINTMSVFKLRNILKYHIIEKERVFFSPDFGDKVVKTLLILNKVVQTVQIAGSGASTKVTDTKMNVANIISYDFLATNGVIHTINKVLMPQ